MMMKQTLVLVIFYLRSVVGVDWCFSGLECNTGQGRLKNTMCKYKSQTATDQCKDIADVQTPDTREEMLNLHNKYRNKLAGGEMQGWPTAANMMEMSWDDEMESVALRWATQCYDGHDECRRTTQFASVGQNYAGQMASDKYEPGANQINFDGWVAEIRIIADPKVMLTSFVGGAWGHFTQVVWAESYKLGCGSVHFEKDGWKSSVDICNYGPAGNVLSLPMYEEGEPVSKCPTGTSPSKQYPNLCAGDGGGDGGGGPGDGGKSDAVGVGPGDSGKSDAGGVGPVGGNRLPGEGNSMGSEPPLGGVTNNGQLVNVIVIGPNQRGLQDLSKDIKTNDSEDILGNRSEKTTVKPEDNNYTSHQSLHPSKQVTCPEVNLKVTSHDHLEHKTCVTTNNTSKTTHKPGKRRQAHKSTVAAPPRLDTSLTIILTILSRMGL